MRWPLLPLAAVLALALLAVFVAPAPVAEAQTPPAHYDTDGDGLIEIDNLAQLNAIRWDLDGDGVPSTGDEDVYAAAFPVAENGSVCPAETTCAGYELTANLDFDENGDGEITDADTAYWNDGAGWEPIGTLRSPYGSAFEGNDHTITNLFMNRGGHYHGLFGALGDSGEIRNLGLEHVALTGNGHAGSLVGLNDGTISAAYAVGTVIGYENVGGLVGTSSGTISDSHFIGLVSITGSYAGGLVGFTQGGSLTATSYAIGIVSGDYDVGGLVGESFGTVSACYAAASVSARLHAGGLMGENEKTGKIIASYATGPVNGSIDVGGLVGYTEPASSIVASYATGTVSGDQFVGGFAGKNYGAIIASYFDTETTGQTIAVAGDDANNNGVIDNDETATPGAAGMGTDDLRSPTGYAGIYADWNVDVDGDAVADGPWDFRESGLYPALSVDLDDDGSATWQEFGYQLHGGMRLSATASGERVALSWNATPVVSTGVAYALYRNWERVVDYNGRSLAYTDIGLTPGRTYAYQVAILLDGLEVGRSNLAVVGGHDSDGDGLIEISSPEQLNAIRYDLNGDGKADKFAHSADYSEPFPAAIDHFTCPAGVTCTGYELDTNLDFAGSPWNSGAGWQSIGGEDSPYTANFEGNNRIIANLFINRSGSSYAGLFGRIISTDRGGKIRNLGLEGANVTAGTYTSILVGATDPGSSVTDCYATGAVDGYATLGGLVGKNHGTITSSYAVVEAGGSSSIGGLAGENLGTISASYATGTVGGNGNVGGLVGHNRGTVKASWAAGSINGTASAAGGLVGANSGRIVRSYAVGPVSGKYLSGGLAGINGGVISASYAVGSVNGDNTAGGLVGLNNEGRSISASYATGAVSGKANLGGLVATNYGTVSESYFDTQTSGQSVAIGRYNTSGAEGKTSVELQAPTEYTGIYSAWNVDLDGDSNPDNPWDFGTDQQYPALKADFNGDDTATWQEFGYQSRLTATASDTQMELNWNALTMPHQPEASITYVLYRDGEKMTGYDGSSTSYTDKGLTTGQTYTYQMATLLDGAEHRRSNTVLVTAISEPLSFGDARLYDYRWHQNVHNGRVDLPAATGGASPLAYTISPDLPAGLVFDPGALTIDGIPTAAQDRVEYTYTVTDANGSMVALPFSILVLPDLKPNFGEQAIDDQHYTEYANVGTVTLTAATGGNGELTYTLTPDLPAGLSFDATTRTITGTPTESLAETEYTYTATDFGDDTASLTFTIEVQASGISMSVSGQVSMREGDAFTYQVSLDAQPAANAVVAVTSDNVDVTVEPSSLTFTPDNWQSAQTVTVSAAHDPNDVNDQAVISHQIDGETVASFNVNVTDDDSDWEILRDFYDAADGDNWTDNTNWLSNKGLRYWHGVSTDDRGQVTHVELRDNNLVGTLAPELGKLEHLEVLSLDRNSISGELPVELGDLSNLTRLAMNRNSLTGAIPTELGSLSNLSIIGLARNQLSGSLPASLSNLSGLTRLSLHDNTGLSGALPSGFTNLADLERLAIANTGLCAPDDEGFSAWLDGVADKPGGVATCGSP